MSRALQRNEPTSTYKRLQAAVIRGLRPPLKETCACALISKKETAMSKMLATLIAGFFAISAFAADAPKAATPETKAPVTAVAKTTKTKAKHHAMAAPKAVKTSAHKAKKATAAPTTTAAPASAPAGK